MFNREELARAFKILVATVAFVTVFEALRGCNCKKEVS